MVTTPTRPYRLSLALAVAAFTVAGCGSSGSDSSSGPSAGVSPTTPSSSPTSSSSAPTSPSASPSAPASSSAGPARCTIADLRVSLGRGEGAAGSTYLPLRLTNTSSQSCSTGGFGGVSLVGDAGEQVGVPADRAQKNLVKVVVLAPGGAAEATLQVTDAGNYPKARCRPMPARGLRVYPPDETRSAFIKLSTTACASDAVHLLRLSPYRSVR